MFLRTDRFARLWLCLMLTVVALLGVGAAIVYPGSLSRVYNDKQASVQGVSFEAESADPRIRLTSTTPGTFELQTESDAPTLTSARLLFRRQRETTPARYLAIRCGGRAVLGVSWGPDAQHQSQTRWVPMLDRADDRSGLQVVHLDDEASSAAVVVVTVQLVHTQGPDEGLKIHSLGFFPEYQPLLQGGYSWLERALERPINNFQLLRWTFGFLILLMFVCSFFASSDWRTQAAIAAYGCLLSLTLLAVAERQTWPAEYGRDFAYWTHRMEKQGGNLGGVFDMATSLRTGVGFTSNHRMPGYAIFFTLSSLSVPLEDRVSMGITAVYAQMILMAISIGVFGWFGCRVLSYPSVVAIVTAWAVHPTQVDYTQGDSIVPAIGILILSQLLNVFAWERDKEREGGVPLRAYLALHLCFAAYFAVRPDILPGWFVLSVVVHWKSWRYLLIPALLYLAVGLSWATYKHAHGGPFVMATSSAAIGAWAGLFEVPDHHFRFECSDGSAGMWCQENGYTQYDDPAAQPFIKSQVQRFYLTYPVYVLSLMLHKDLEFFTVQNSGTAWAHPLADVVVSRLARWKWIFFVFVLASASSGYEVRRTFFLIWPFFLIAPIFSLFYASGGRFTYFVTYSIVAAALSLLLDPGAWRQMARRWKIAIPVLVLGLTFGLFASQLDDALLHNDSLRYWAPLLDASYFDGWVKR